MCTYNIQTWAEYKRPRTLSILHQRSLAAPQAMWQQFFAVYNRLTLPGAISCTPLLQIAGTAHRRAVLFTTSSHTHRITEACLCHKRSPILVQFSAFQVKLEPVETPSAAAVHATQQQTFPCGIQPSTSRPHPRLPDSFDVELNGNRTGQTTNILLV